MLVPLQLDPTPRQLRTFAIAWVLVFGVIAAMLWSKGSLFAGGVLAVLALGVPLVGVVLPVVLRWAFIGLSVVTFPIGLVVGFVVLTLVFFVVVTPVGLVMRLFGHDPMGVRDTNLESYWKPRTGRPTPESYLRQYVRLSSDSTND